MAGPADMPSATSLDPVWADQALGSPPPAPAPLDPSQAPCTVRPAWTPAGAARPPPPGPAPVDSDFGDQAAQEPVHSPTSLDVSWRDQVPPPGPAPVDAGFGEPGAPFGAGPQAGGDPYGQAAYPYGAGPGDQADFVSAPARRSARRGDAPA